jgi:hypothetical protein
MSYVSPGIRALVSYTLAIPQARINANISCIRCDHFAYAEPLHRNCPSPPVATSSSFLLQPTLHWSTYRPFPGVSVADICCIRPRLTTKSPRKPITAGEYDYAGHAHLLTPITIDNWAVTACIEVSGDNHLVLVWYLIWFASTERL